MTRPASGPGRLLERNGDVAPRGMTVHDRTRLNGRLRLFTLPSARCAACLHGSSYDPPESLAAQGFPTPLTQGGKQGKSGRGNAAALWILRGSITCIQITLWKRPAAPELLRRSMGFGRRPPIAYDQNFSKFNALFGTPQKLREFLTNRVFPFDLQAIFP